MTEYAEYKEFMDKYLNLRRLDEKDFENYFAVVILNENTEKLLNVNVNRKMYNFDKTLMYNFD